MNGGNSVWVVETKAQGIMIDFAIALMVFLMVWFYLGSQFDSKLASTARENDARQMKIRADYALDTLVKGPGSPADWEGRDINALIYPGLAQADRDLSQPKLSAFANQPQNYSRIKDSLGLGAYDFHFSFSSPGAGVDVNAGIAAQGSATVAVAQRVAGYNGKIGTATLAVYRLEG